LMINPGREYVYRPEFGEPVYTGSRYRLVEVVNAEIQILNSRDLKMEVINTIGLENIYPTLLTEDKPLEMAVQTFSKKLAIKSIIDSNVIQLAFTHQDPVITAKALNLLIEEYNQKHLDIYGNSALPFLEEQLRITEEQLKTAENELENYRQRYGVYDIDKQTELLLSQRSDLERTLNTVENEIKELEQKDIVLHAQMDAIPKNVPMYTETKTDDINSESRARLLELQMEEQKLLGKYTENSRLVQNIRDEINSVKNLLASQGSTNTGMVRTGKNPVLEAIELESLRLKASLQSLLAKRDVVKQQLEELNTQLREIDTRQNKVRELERNLSATTKNHNAYLEKLEEAKSQSALDRMKSTSIRIVQSAEVPIKPLGLSLKLRLVLGMFFGLLAGVCLAFVAEISQRRLSNAYAVEQRLQLPILTVLPDRE
jgi:polysaccharide biosynthesis protein PslE